MRLILHVGMGKTGTSSIQNALKSAPESLQEQKVHYLGMWFDIVAPKYQKIPGMREFLRSGEKNLEAGAGKFLEKMEAVHKETGAETFIFSNEDLYGHIEFIEPFVRALQEKITVEMIMYVRPIQSWLPSAYVQWGIRHKTRNGPVLPFREAAKTLTGAYRALATWHDRFGDILDIRMFDKSVDAVTDFGQSIGIQIPPLEKRVLERAEDTEVLLRALFNDRYKGEVFPERFNNVVINTGKTPIPALETLIDDFLGFNGVDEAIADQKELFDSIGKKIGLDFISGEAKKTAAPDVQAVRDRIVDYLVQISLGQSERIARLATRVAKLEDHLDDS